MGRRLSHAVSLQPRLAEQGQVARLLTASPVLRYSHAVAGKAAEQPQADAVVVPAA